ncbi:MAG: FliH/SctL family protein [Opitutaceae bacterium]
MAVTRHSISFTGPFVLAAEAIEPVRRFTEADLAAEFERGRREGARQNDNGVERRFVEFRSEVNGVQNGIFARLSEAEKMIAEQMRVALPELAVEVAKRVLAGYTPPQEVVEQLCAEAMKALFPEVQDLELIVGERDHAIIENLVPQWRATYPGIKVTIDPAFTSGECQVRSRFGVIDARHGAKVEALRRELTRK